MWDTYLWLLLLLMAVAGVAPEPSWGGGTL